MTSHSGGGSPTVQQLIHHQPQQTQSKIIVSSSGTMTSSSTLQHQQQLQKFLATTLSSSTATINTATQKIIVQQQQHSIGIFQQQSSSPQKNVISALSSSGPVAMDAQTLVNTLMAANSKDLLSAFNSSMGGGGSGGVHQMQIQPVPQHATVTTANTTVLPISIQQNVQEQQLKQTTFIRTNSGSLASALQGVIAHQQQQQQGPQHQQLLTFQTNHSSATQPIVVVIQGSSLNTQSLQLPSSSLASNNNSSGNINNKIGTVPTATTITSASIPNLLDSDDLNLGLGSFSLGGMNLDLGGGNLSEMGSGAMGSVVGIKLEMDCGMDKMDDLSMVLDGNPFDSIPNLSNEQTSR